MTTPQKSSFDPNRKSNLDQMVLTGSRRSWNHYLKMIALMILFIGVTALTTRGASLFLLLIPVAGFPMHYLRIRSDLEIHDETAGLHKDAYYRELSAQITFIKSGGLGSYFNSEDPAAMLFLTRASWFQKIRWKLASSPIR